MMTREEQLDALITLPRVRTSAVSPDGRWVAWVWQGVSETIDVYAAPTDGSAAPVRLSDGGGRSILSSWAPDSSAVLLVQDHDGDERFRLFLAPLATPGTMQPITEENPAFFLRGGSLHPNGRWAFYAANLDPVTGEESEVTSIFRHDLQTGKRSVLATPEKPAYFVPQLNHDGTYILYNRKDLHPSGTQVWITDVEGTRDLEVLNFGAEAKVTAKWMPDSVHGLVLAEGATHRSLIVWDSRTDDMRTLIDDPARNIEDAYAPFGTNLIVVIEVASARVHASLLDPESGQETPIAVSEGNLVPLAPAANSNRWVGRYYSARYPGDIVLFDPANPDPATFTSLSRVWERTTVTPGMLVPSQDFRWKSVDGREIQGWLYRPVNTGEPKGTIVSVHGGPTYHSEDATSPEIQFYVSQGYNVLDPNYRGSTGFGLDFQNAIKEDGWGGREQDDIRTGIEALIAQGIAQPGKVGITGTSYGGYSAWCAITHWPPDVLAASAPICGMTDLVVDYNTTRPDLRPYSEEMIGGTPEQAPERYYERSPINFVGNIRGALLIVQGMQDPNVSPENVRAVEQALEKAGVPYDVLPFEDEGHGVYKITNQKRLYIRLLDFFESAFARANQTRTEEQPT